MLCASVDCLTVTLAKVNAQYLVPSIDSLGVGKKILCFNLIVIIPALPFSWKIAIKSFPSSINTIWLSDGTLGYKRTNTYFFLSIQSFQYNDLVPWHLPMPIMIVPFFLVL